MSRTTNSEPPDTTSRTVLIVEDDRVINDALGDRFRAEGYRVLQAFDGPQGVDRARETAPDVVVLDVMLPGYDGHEVCRRLQSDRPVPVLMLTARDDEADLLVGLAVGADDYLTKPFSMREVVARVAALLRRVERAAELASRTERPTLTCGSLVIDTAARRTLVAGTEVHLTSTEFDLLVCLAGTPGEVQTRERLLAEVWGWGAQALTGAAAATRTVDSHVKALRAKIGADRLRTVHGVGYSVEAVDA